jgi:hypothetical protein
VASEFEITRGATFQLMMTVLNDDGTPYNGPTLSITCGLRTASNALVTLLDVQPAETPGVFTLQATTDNWPLGRLGGDFRISDGTTVVYSGGFGVSVLQNMTPAPA